MHAWMMMDKMDVCGWVGCMDSHRKRGAFEAAVTDYTTAIRLNPQHCRAYYNRAFSYDRCHTLTLTLTQPNPNPHPQP